MNQRFKPGPIVDSRKCHVLLAALGISRRHLARELGLHHLIVVRTLANLPGVARDKRVAVVRSLAERGGLPVKKIVVCMSKVKPAEPGEAPTPHSAEAGSEELKGEPGGPQISVRKSR
jgi:hypothetical protein